VLQPPALQVAIECLTHMGGQLLASLGQVFDKGRVMALDDLVKQRLLGPVALVTRTAHFHIARPPPLESIKTAGWRTAGTPSVSQ